MKKDRGIERTVVMASTAMVTGTQIELAGLVVSLQLTFLLLVKLTGSGVIENFR